MTILLINNYFLPEIGAASHLYYYLAKELVKRNHRVIILTGIPRYNVSKETYKSYAAKTGKNGSLVENIDNIEVLRVELPYVERKQVLRRGIEHFEIAWKLYSKSKNLLDNVDVILVYSPPLTLYITAEKLRKKFNAPFVLNVQDLFPQAAIDLGIMKNRLLISFFRRLERKAYNSADLITVHSERNKDFVDKIERNPEKTIVLENWVDDTEIRPGPKINDFSIKYDLKDRFVVSFAGTLGFSQNVEVMIRAANELKNVKDILFLIVGNGVRMSEAQKLVESFGLTNVMFLPPVPREMYPLVLNSSDISLTTLQDEVRTPVVPSKILSIMSAGIPIIASMNLDGDAPKLIEKARAGFCVSAGDYKTLAEKIRLLYKNPSLREEMGKNGRKYIETHLSARKAAEKYEQLFLKLLSSQGGKRYELSRVL